MDAQPPLIRVVFVLLPGSLVLDWAGPAEALRIANQRLRATGAPPRFAIEFASPRPDTVGSVGIALTGLAPLPDLLTADGADGAAWVVLVGMPGDTIPIDTPETQDLLHWLRGLRLEAGRLELLTICAGSLLAAHAGALAGRRATTHHHHLDELRAVEPRCEVVGNRVFVLDPPVYSSAGVTTGIDLLLHRIADTCGEALAAQVAQTMVVALRRGPHDPELSPFLAYRNHLHAALHRVQDAVSERPQADWNVPRMAEVAHTSARHLTRLFVEHAGVAPLAYLRRLRLAAAQLALASGASVTRAAELSGFGSDTQLRRAWHQFGLPGSPSDAAGLARG
ncbi:AraC family transcriptional regulator [Variovorax paradoxus]|jgi:transcriptional regulator GlxA family with amidase domain|uniref:GlxA family transcriptional regulator n=1 Tax=Variovorax paradoxus TaxID=34073 RepID=UPI0006E6057E|nr:AraC family transcriptional regulator [Variovorax paradoxus]KPV03057.1 AraC family transcriptional regulator [Variovorax paradoxus]KPV05420.1 AraC family transcriptional regulator [Variovorax paradoxus]KPV19243.1 AraC family transcriptional regulator [Variovorax paradoxus]KPV19254.1 AraC family transcriptional regulator [Variovorax paradoxus]